MCLNELESGYQQFNSFANNNKFIVEYTPYDLMIEDTL